MCEGLRPFIEGEDKMREEEGKVQRTWKIRDQRVFGLIARGHLNNFIHHVADLPTSKDAYEALDKLFGAKGKNSNVSM